MPRGPENPSRAPNSHIRMKSDSDSTLHLQNIWLAVWLNRS